MLVGRWSLVVGRWSLVVGRWSLVVGRWSLVVGRWAIGLRNGGGGFRGQTTGTDASYGSPRCIIVGATIYRETCFRRSEERERNIPWQSERFVSANPAERDDTCRAES